MVLNWHNQETMVHRSSHQLLAQKSSRKTPVPYTFGIDETTILDRIDVLSQGIATPGEVSSSRLQAPRTEYSRPIGTLVVQKGNATNKTNGDLTLATRHLSRRSMADRC